MVRHARLDTKCPNCGKQWAILLTKKELKTLLRQVKLEHKMLPIVGVKKNGSFTTTP